MVKVKIVALLCLSFVFTSCFAQKGLNDKKEKEEQVIGTISKENISFNREMILGNILKNYLENVHYSKKKLDDDLSGRAFEKLIETLDYGKRFLLAEDIKTLKTFKWKLDDEMVSGVLNSVNVGSDLVLKRLKEVEPFVKKTLEKEFDFNKKEELETDPEKRKFQSNMDELKDLWRRILKYDTLNRYLALKDENKAIEANKKDKKKSKPLSEKELLEKARKAVEKNYTNFFKRMKKEKKRDRLDKFYNSITSIYDPHTTYLIPEDHEDFNIRMSGKLEGIGAVLAEEDSYIKVEKIIPGGPSYRQKELKAEDLILSVAQGDEEAVSIVDMGIRDAVKLIRGKKGSVVRLTVKKPDQSIHVISIVRDVVEVEENYVKYSVLEYGEQKTPIGYIMIPSFYRDFSSSDGRNCSDDTREAIKELKKKNVKGMILDLRNNGGGALEDARQISGLFIKDGPIVQVRSSHGAVDILKDTDTQIQYPGPLVVLINRFSASASEIVAAALQDYGRAIIIGGEHSHGKGTVQAVVELDNSNFNAAALAKATGSNKSLGALKITIQKFYRVNGKSTQREGVTPDIILPDQYGYLETGERYLDNALPGGSVDGVEYKKWGDRKQLKIDDLVKKSKERVKKSAQFEKVIERTQWYKERKEFTKKTLVFDDFVKDKESVKALSDKFKTDEENDKIIVLAAQQFPNKESKERFEEFKKTLRSDPYLEEILLIMGDYLKDLGQE